MKEKTLVLIKPDAVERNLIGRILTEYERNHLKVIKMKMIDVPREIAEKHYAEHKQKPFFDSLVSYLTRSPIIALVLEGENVVERVRVLNGATDPEDAEDNTIRSLYGIQLSENTVHASDSLASARREMAIWFN